ncbi:MAG: 50S ribosomal protein L10 [Candidatus Cloacimonetes bacterium]|nr:50S ribosomal protein L10 [Candidatus Cloacimonadota bacterium]
MVQSYKIDAVSNVKSRLENAKSIILVDYKGVNIEEVDELRTRMRNAGVDYFVSKNTFIKIALNELGIKELDDYLAGPTAVAVTRIDEVAPARELANFKKDVTQEKDYPSFKIGFVDGRLMDAQKLSILAELPGKEVLIAQILQSLNSPVAGFIGVLQGILRKLVLVVDAIAEKKAKN